MSKIKVTQVKSPIGRRKDQRETLVGLGLNKLHRTRVLADNPATRGRVEKVKHLVVFETLDGAETAKG
jgi:large subunit ribosomal protein L30